MSDVKARLAAAGWSDKTHGGFEIVAFEENGIDGFAGLVSCQGHVTAEYWEIDGSYYSDGSVSNWDPVPAPVAVQDEQPQPEWHTSDAKLVDFATNGKPFEQVLARELIAARKRIAELEHDLGCTQNAFGIAKQRITELEANCMKWMDKVEQLQNEAKRGPVAQCPPVQKLATSGPSITRPVPAVDAWVAWNGKNTDTSFRVDAIETIDGKTRIISGAASIPVSEFVVTGPSDRGPWRPIGEVR